jgi:HSP20 family molecular chaperone IbpA
MQKIAIPMDIYESPKEIVIMIPLGWVQKKSIELYFDDFKLMITWTRIKPKLKDDFTIQQDECYRGEFTQEVQLPPYIYFDRIQSTVNTENVLIVTVPKSLHPGKMKVDVKI